MAGSDNSKTSKKKAAKIKKPMSHPKYSEMIKTAIIRLKERGGSSRQAIYKFIIANYNVGKNSRVVGTHLKMSLRAGVANGLLKQCKGTGASGSFKIAVSQTDTVKANRPTAKTSKTVRNTKASKSKPPKKAAEKTTKRPAQKTKKSKNLKKAKTVKPKTVKGKAKKSPKKSSKKK